MDAAMERRVVVATSWVSTRIAVLDKEERYEDSYALTQEFCEWITCIGEDESMLESSVMTVPFLIKDLEVRMSSSLAVIDLISIVS